MAIAKKTNEDQEGKKGVDLFRPPFRPERKASMRDLFLQELQSLYYVEKAVAGTFPKIIKNACNYELIEAIHLHQADTANQLLRLDQTFEMLKEKPLLTHCAAIDAMIHELDEKMEITKFGVLRDAGMILSLSKIEHYEIASYRILSLYAEAMKWDDIVLLLDRSLNEEKVAQLRLEKMATALRPDQSEEQR